MEPAQSLPPDGDNSVRQALGDVVDSSQKLVQHRLDLFRMDLQEALESATTRMAGIGLSIALVLSGALSLGQAATGFLATIMPAYAASGIVSGTCFIGALIAARMANPATMLKKPSRTGDGRGQS